MRAERLDGPGSAALLSATEVLEVESARILNTLRDEDIIDWHGILATAADDL